jgi:hypothetical protein
MGSVKKKANESGIRRVSGEEFRELSSLAVRDEALSTDTFEARILPDGRVLHAFLFTRNRGNLYPSREAFAEMLRQCAEMPKGPIDHCLTLLPPIDDFLRDVEAHAKSLGPRLRIPDDVLDGTPASLDAVDKALKRIPWAKRQVPDLVTPLVAYLGEVMRKSTGGQWSKAPSQPPPQRPDPAAVALVQAAVADAEKAATEGATPAQIEAFRKALFVAEGDEKDASIAAMIERFRKAYEAAGAPEVPIILSIPTGSNENEPMITTRGGGLFQPFASVFLPMVEPSRRIPLRSSPGVPYKPEAGPSGTLLNPVAQPIPPAPDPDPSKVK